MAYSLELVQLHFQSTVYQGPKNREYCRKGQKMRLIKENGDNFNLRQIVIIKQLGRVWIYVHVQAKQLL
jgi:hypothetical protein